MFNAGFAEDMAVHQEETPDRARLGLLIAVLASAAFWVALGIIVLVLLRRG